MDVRCASTVNDVALASTDRSLDARGLAHCRVPRVIRRSNGEQESDTTSHEGVQRGEALHQDLREEVLDAEKKRLIKK